jgi:hypothetical protein
VKIFLIGVMSFFECWGPLFKINFFTDEVQTDWAKACGIKKQWHE